MIERFSLSETTGLYRSRRGLILGVCRGIADARAFSVFWTRIIAVALFFLTGFWPVVVVYLLAAILLKPEPILPLRDPEDREFYNTYTTSRSVAVRRLKRTYDNLERRIQRLETSVTNRERDWERRFWREEL